MRTTVTLDPDTEDLIRKEVRRGQSSFKRVLNEAIRRGLGPVGEGRRGAAEVKTFRSPYQPGVDRTRLQQMADEMETEEMRRRHQGRP